MKGMARNMILAGSELDEIVAVVKADDDNAITRSNRGKIPVSKKTSGQRTYGSINWPAVIVLTLALVVTIMFDAFNSLDDKTCALLDKDFCKDFHGETEAKFKTLHPAWDRDKAAMHCEPTLYKLLFASDCGRAKSNFTVIFECILLFFICINFTGYVYYMADTYGCVLYLSIVAMFIIIIASQLPIVHSFCNAIYQLPSMTAVMMGLVGAGIWKFTK